MSFASTSWARPARALNLAGACVLNWGADVIYTLPATLSVPLRDHLELSEAQFEFLISATYTAFAIPNIVLPFCTGPLVNRFGQRTVLIGTVVCMVLGQIVFTWAIGTRQIWVIALGRVIYGLGGEIAGVVANDLVTKWFEHSHLALALAILHDASRLGGATTSLLTPRLLGRSVPFATNIITFISTVPLAFSCASLALSMPSFSKAPSQSLAPSTISVRTTSTKKGLFASIAALPPPFWVFIHVSMMVYAAIAGFNVVAQRHLAATFYDGSEVAAGTALSVPPLLAVVLVPFFGHLLDKPWATVPRGFIVASISVVVGHGLLVVRVLGAVVPLVFLGVGGGGFGALFGLGVAESVGRGKKREVVLGIGGAYTRIESAERDEDEEEEDTGDELTESMLMSNMSNSTATRTTEDQSEGSEVVTVAFGTAVGLLNAMGAVVPLMIAPLEAKTDDSTIGSFAAVQIFLGALAGVALLLCIRLDKVWRAM